MINSGKIYPTDNTKTEENRKLKLSIPGKNPYVKTKEKTPLNSERNSLSKIHLRKVKLKKIDLKNT